MITSKITTALKKGPVVDLFAVKLKHFQNAFNALVSILFFAALLFLSNAFLNLTVS